MKAVIIAGGRGKRLDKITKKIPKSLVEIDKKPVLEHQINLLVKNGIKEVWLLIGYKGEMIHDYFGDGKKWNIKIHYSLEERSLGTAGAVKSIAKKLSGDFLVLYGDVMVNFNIKRFIDFHSLYSKDSLATIVVHPNDHPLESDLVEVKHKQVVNIYPKPQLSGAWKHNLVSAAVYILSPKIFSFIPTNKETDFGKNIFPQLLKKKKKIFAYNTWEYLRDVGSQSRLKTIRRDYRLGIYHRLNYQNKQKAVFLDRNVVINEEFKNIDDLKVYPSSYSAIKKINQSKFHTIVIASHPTDAGQKLSEIQLDEVECKLESLLGGQGVKIDAIYYGPQPNMRLIERAVKDFNIDLKDSYFIYDSKHDDYLLAKNAGVNLIGVEVDHDQELLAYDKLKPGKMLLKKDLVEAVNYILKHGN